MKSFKLFNLLLKCLPLDKSIEELTACGFNFGDSLTNVAFDRSFLLLLLELLLLELLLLLLLLLLVRDLFVLSPSWSKFTEVLNSNALFVAGSSCFIDFFELLEFFELDDDELFEMLLS